MAKKIFWWLSNLTIVFELALPVRLVTAGAPAGSITAAQRTCMCRPRRGARRHCDLKWFKGGPHLRSMPPLGRPDAQLPPFPQRKKRRRYRVKTTEAPAAEVDKQTISGYEPQPQTQAGDIRDEGIEPGDEPQQISPTADQVEKPTISGDGLQPQTPAGNRIGEDVAPGYEPQQAGHGDQPDATS